MRETNSRMRLLELIAFKVNMIRDPLMSGRPRLSLYPCFGQVKSGEKPLSIKTITPSFTPPTPSSWPPILTALSLTLSTRMVADQHSPTFPSLHFASFSCECYILILRSGLPFMTFSVTDGLRPSNAVQWRRRRRP